jgi:hypothetical protein
VQLPRFVRRGEQGRMRALRLHARLLGGFARLGADELRVFGDIAFEEIGDAEQQVGAVAIAHLAHLGQRLARGGNGSVHGAGIGLRHRAHRRAVVGQLHRLVGRGVDPLTADVVQARFSQFQGSHRDGTSVTFRCADRPKRVLLLC